MHGYGTHGRGFAGPANLQCCFATSARPGLLLQITGTYVAVMTHKQELNVFAMRLACSIYDCGLGNQIVIITHASHYMHVWA